MNHTTDCATLTKEEKVLVVNVFDTHNKGKYHGIQSLCFPTSVRPRTTMQPSVRVRSRYHGYHWGILVKSDELCENGMNRVCIF